MKWPRGRWNHRRLVGCEVKVTLDITKWQLRWPNRYGRCARIGPIRVFFMAVYDWTEKTST